MPASDDNDGHTIMELYGDLCKAIEENHTGDVTRLLERGANPNLLQTHHSPLFKAMIGDCRPAIIDLL